MVMFCDWLNVKFDEKLNNIYFINKYVFFSYSNFANNKENFITTLLIKIRKMRLVFVFIVLKNFIALKFISHIYLHWTNYLAVNLRYNLDIVFIKIKFLGLSMVILQILTIWKRKYIGYRKDIKYILDIVGICRKMYLENIYFFRVYFG